MSEVPSIQGLTERKLTKQNEQFHTLFKWFEKEAILFLYAIIGMAMLHLSS